MQQKREKSSLNKKCVMSKNDDGQFGSCRQKKKDFVKCHSQMLF